MTLSDCPEEKHWIHTHLWRRWFLSAPAQEKACLNRYLLHSVRSKHRSAQESSLLTKLGVWSLQRHREKERVGGLQHSHSTLCMLWWCYWKSFPLVIPHWCKTHREESYLHCVSSHASVLCSACNSVQHSLTECFYLQCCFYPESCVITVGVWSSLHLCRWAHLQANTHTLKIVFLNCQTVST